MATKKVISKAVIGRLPRYHRYLGELLDKGVERISSGELSEIMGVTASQIRQDLNNFGGFGQQGYGYNVSYLRQEIGKLLGLDSDHRMVILGAGNMGKTLVRYFKDHISSFNVVGVFDANPEIQGKKVECLTVMSNHDLFDYVENVKADIGIITVPRAVAQNAANDLIKAGIKAIWNFARVDLEVPDDVIVENVHLTDSLLRLSYSLSTENKKGKK